MLHGLAEGAGSRERGAPLGSSRPALRRPETLVRAPWLSRWAKGGGGRRGSRPGRARGPVAARREEARRGGSGPRGGEGRPREGGDPVASAEWRGKEARERGGEGERPSHVDEGRHKGCTEKQTTDVGSHQMANRTAANKRMTWTASLCAVGRNFHL